MHAILTHLQHLMQNIIQKQWDRNPSGTTSGSRIRSGCVSCGSRPAFRRRSYGRWAAAAAGSAWPDGFPQVQRFPSGVVPVLAARMNMGGRQSRSTAEW